MPGHPFERLSYDKQYDQALSYLYNLQKFGIKFGLSKTENLLKAFKNPQRHLKCIHIAGSNGKGSVAAMLASIYSRAGYKVGLFTSPHLIDFRERFQINGRMISKAQTLDLIKEIQEKSDPQEPPTFFEFVTAMALLFFYREQVDLAIMETGLGGRLDATNIIQPLITVITTISLEHQEYLGKTLQSIALEKGGIIKHRIPLITGVSQKKVQVFLEEVCQRQQAPMLLAGRDFKTRKTGQGRFSYYGFYSSGFGMKKPFGVQRSSFVEGRNITHHVKMNSVNKKLDLISDLKKTPNAERLFATCHSSLRLGLLGDHQIKNAGLALAVVQRLQENYPLSEESIREGLQKVNWPGRMEVLSQRPWLVLDGAHNPGAMKTLSQNIPRVFSYKKLHLIFGMMKDKDIGPTTDYMIPLADRVFLTRAEYDRSAEPEALRPFIERKNLPCSLFPTIPSAIKQALKIAGPKDLILITGSLFIVGEARAWWEREGSGLEPPG